MIFASQLVRAVLPHVIAFLGRHLFPETGPAATAAAAAAGASASGAAGAVGGGTSVFGSAAGMAVSALATAASVLGGAPGRTPTSDSAAASNAGCRPPGPLPSPVLALAVVTATSLVELVPNIDSYSADFTNQLVAALISLANRPSCPEHVRRRRRRR